MQPIVDDAASTLAGAWSKALLDNVRAGKPFSDDVATAEAARALIDRVKGILDDAMDEPIEGGDGSTPRQAIETSLKSLKNIDRGLKRIAAKKGDPKERDLLIGWLSILSKYQ